MHGAQGPAFAAELDCPAHAAFALLQRAASTSTGASRRQFIATMMAATAASSLASVTSAATPVVDKPDATATVDVSFEVNGRATRLTLDPRVTLLDALREHLR